MNLKKSDLIHTVPTTMASLLAVVVAFYAITLLAVGETFTVVLETPIEEINEEFQIPKMMNIVHVPYPPAFVPLVAAALLLAGLLGRKQMLAWIGLGILLLFSLLFLFGNGGILLPIAGLLLILLLLINFIQKRSPGQPENRLIHS